MTHWTHNAAMKMHMLEIVALTQKKVGLHFNARHATPVQLEGFDIEEMAKMMLTMAPLTWNLFGALLNANPALAKRRER
ncbi:hypothetical protein SCP_1100500 [Sparassis crispa]|uniref:Uncharacterized protein n=1 Tax=Sparassis crispa TaxID=139825 RepID=A0A401GYY4_9APHY|nr:hypothetical protein SCP_1100500 [Sparassis crispa]GBE87375.1 hypothetical protein SCP_1100500 [Sparassis crispa]